MAERSTVAQVVQIGLEAAGTPGTAVAATRRLGSLSITPGIHNEAATFRPAGLKYPSIVAQTQEWSEADVEGAPTYEELIIPLSGALTKGVVAQVLNGATPVPGAYEWTFSPKSAGADTPATFTLEQGEPGVAGGEQFTHLLFTSFGLDVSRSEVSLSGDAFLRRVTSGFTPTAGLAVPAALTPLLPGQASVFLSDTFGNLGQAADRLTRVVSLNPSVGGRYNPAWFVNALEPSFTSYVENPDGVDATFDLVVEADATGMAFLPRMRKGTTHFLRLEFVGPELGATGSGVFALFRWDMAVKVADVDTWSDEDGVYAIPWTLQIVHDGGWGKAQQIVVRNSVASL